MNYCLRFFFITFLLLFTFISDGVTQENYSESLERIFLQAVKDGDIEHVESLLKSGVNVHSIDELGRTAATLAVLNDKANILELLLGKGGYVCSDYIIDVRPEYFDQTDENITLDLTGDLLGPVDRDQVSLEGYRVRLELLFALREFSNSVASFLVTGIGESRNIQGDLGTLFGGLDVPFGITLEERPFRITITDVVKETVRSGYQKLRESLRDQGLWQQRLIGIINAVSDEEIRVSLGRSNGVQEGDIFNVYPKLDNNYCYRYYDRLTTATTTAMVVQVNEYHSILEVQSTQNGNRTVQRGDIVQIASDIDFASRIIQDSASRENVLRIGYIPNIVVSNRTNNEREESTDESSDEQDNDRITIITPDIIESLIQEARDFGFRVVL